MNYVYTFLNSLQVAILTLVVLVPPGKDPQDYGNHLIEAVNYLDKYERDIVSFSYTEVME